METSHKPELIPLKHGKVFKTLRVTGLTGMTMPLHHSTTEAVIVVKKGRAELVMPNNRHVLKEGTSFIIPAKIEHSLTIMEDFEALAIMGLDSEIKFN